jgi:hypothetical protein
LPVAIPELAPGSPLLQALPEFKALENYGGATIEANIQAAATRFKLFNKAIDDVKLKVTALNNRPNELLGSDWQVSESFSAGAEISEDDINAFRTILRRNENTDLRAAYRTFLSLNPSEAIGGQPKNIARLIQFLRSDDPNVPVSELIEAGLRRGIKFTPATNRNGSGSTPTPVGDILIPFKVTDGVVEPAVDLSGYRQALTSLNDFRMQNIFPKGLDPKTISLRISATQADFEADFNKISRTNRNLSGTQGANVTLRPDGSPVTRSEDIAGSMEGKTSVILINDEFNARTPGEFGGENSVAETVLHEYGHSVHRALGIGWGDPSSVDPNYQAVRAQRVSNYGDNNDQEHFAETFAKYIFTGEATPEFKSFLEEQVGIKKFDLDSAFPAWLRGNTARDQFLEKMNSTDLGVYTVSIDTFNNPYANYSTNQLAEIAQSTIDTGVYRPATITFTGKILDSSGRAAGTFTRTLNRDSDGKLWVYHNYFKMNEDAQGGGFGTPFIEASFDLYREWGADHVDVTAALTNGPYMWALRGFDFTSTADRTKRIALAKDMLAVLRNYKENQSEYDNKSSTQAAADIRASLASQGVPLDGRQMSVNSIVEMLRANGWVVDEELLAELSGLSNLPSSKITANMLANIGRKKKRSADKSSSSVGRIIMMISSWSGRKKL